MPGQRGLWDVEERLKELSAEGDPLEKLGATVDFELFRPVLTKALGGSGPQRMSGWRSGQSPLCCTQCASTARSISSLGLAQSPRPPGSTHGIRRCATGRSSAGVPSGAWSHIALCRHLAQGDKRARL